MSRLGKIPIKVPKEVDVSVTPDMKVTVKGPKGQLQIDTRKRVTVKFDNGQVVVDRPDDTKESRAYHGLYQRLVTNMITGVSQGFTKKLEIQGVGYRAFKEGKGITLNLGYSHPIHFAAPEGITIDVPDATKITVSGYDKQLVGQVAADIRRFRPPEPYKGKGIRYAGEYVRRKVGKTGA